MALIKWTPFFEPLLDIERSFDSFPIRADFNPAVDLYESGDAVVVDVALAGIDPKDLSISIEDSVLSVEGKSEKKTEVDEKNYYRREVRSGSFHRVVSLPTAVMGEKATAAYDKGILTITMPKKETARPAKIDIKVNEN